MNDKKLDRNVRAMLVGQMVGSTCVTISLGLGVLVGYLCARPTSACPDAAQPGADSQKVVNDTLSWSADVKPLIIRDGVNMKPAYNAVIRANEKSR